MNNDEFRKLSTHDKAMVTHKALQERKRLREKGKQEALDHLYENTYRIRKAVAGIKRSKPAW